MPDEVEGWKVAKFAHPAADSSPRSSSVSWFNGSSRPMVTAWGIVCAMLLYPYAMATSCGNWKRLMERDLACLGESIFSTLICQSFEGHRPELAGQQCRKGWWSHSEKAVPAVVCSGSRNSDAHLCNVAGVQHIAVHQRHRHQYHAGQTPHVWLEGTT